MVDLKTFVNESQVAKVMFEEFSSRQRYRDNTNVHHLHNTLRTKGVKLSEDDIITAFKQLTEMGIGKIIFGRGKNPTRFLWNYNLKDVAKAAQGKKPLEEAQLLKAVSRAKQQIKANAASAKPSEMITITIPKNMFDALKDILKTA